jgi:uncharacterized protein YjbI with pentapeptide repeats
LNDRSQPAAPPGLEEAPASFAPAGSGLRVDELRGRDLRNVDLGEFPGLLPEHLAGSDLTGNQTVPEEIKNFPALEQVRAISAEARKVFIGLLAACVYSWLVIGTTTDVALILNTASSPLPVINASIPIAGFYAVGGAILAAVYCYLHFYLLRLWRTLATLPAIFPDGVALDDRTDPWLLTNLVRSEMPRVPARPLGVLEHRLSVFLAWWLVPVTLLALWARYLPAHGLKGTALLVALIGFTVLFGRHTFNLSRSMLCRQMPSGWSKPAGHQQQILLIAVLRGLGRLRRDNVAAWLTVSLAVCSTSAFRDNPRDPYTWLAKGLNALNFVGVRTYANLRDAQVAERPAGWDGKDWAKVKRVDLKGLNLAFADLTRAFVANADLRGVNLTGAVLERAELQGSDLYDEDQHRGVEFQGTDLRSIQLQGANLRGAKFLGVDLREAQLQNTDLREAQLQGTDLRLAQLQHANLSDAELRGANLGGAQLQSATLTAARLQSANLAGAQLQNANLAGAQLQGAFAFRAELRDANLANARLQGTTLRGAQLQSTRLKKAQLQSADLQGANLQGTDLEEAELQGADLQYTRMQGANLRAAQLQGADLFQAQLQGADLRASQLQGASLRFAQLQGVDLRGAALWRTLLPHEVSAWRLADIRGSNETPIATHVLDEWITAKEESIPEPRRGLMITRLRRALVTEIRPAMPSFPGAWDTWATEKAYDEDLARFLGDLACGTEAPEARTLGLARRAILTNFGSFGLEAEPERLWLRQLAQRIIGPDCPPAKGLPNDMRRQLEQLGGS